MKPYKDVALTYTHNIEFLVVSFDEFVTSNLGVVDAIPQFDVL